MRTITFLMIFLGLMTAGQAQKMNFFDFKVLDINGKPFNLSQLKGKKILVVNVASKCGYTPQYKDLETLFKKYGGEKFTILAFPANNFGSQEPGSNQEIAEFCSKNYNVTFLMMSKISVTGDDIHPLYKWLTQKSENGVLDAPVQWNFQKFLVDEAGKLRGSYPSKINPISPEITDWLDNK
jgi:glutathione peroxidase